MLDKFQQHQIMNEESVIGGATATEYIILL